MEDILSLTEEDFRTVLCTIAKRNPFPNSTAYITNKFQKARKEEKGPTKKPNQVNQTSLFRKPEPPKLKPGRLPITSSRAAESSSPASLLPDLHGRSIWNVGPNNIEHSQNKILSEDKCHVYFFINSGASRSEG